MEPRETANIGTNTNPFNQIGLINTDKSKKKPFNISFKNFDPNEPKIRKSNLLYTDKQKFRKYKTKIEPKLYSKIMVDDEEDLIAKIRKEFGIEDKTRKNYSEVETSGMPYYQEPIPTKGEPPYIVPLLDADFTDITNDDIEDMIGELTTSIENRFKISDVAKEDLLPLDADFTDMTNDDIEDIVGELITSVENRFQLEDEEEPAALTREASRGTELSAFNTEVSEDLYDKAERYGITYAGRKPTTKAGIEARERDILSKIAEIDAKRGMAKK